ncbi:MAG: DUF3098 domain-containing protein [Bacteroidales bacterium]|nr:DUF3098 domain-containing protein [Bacteroidales bacterium]OPZ96147.1 MAG: hypothetical protein BWY72_01794 [Bacteroidetes bacterium ADurb.Bin416]
MQKEDTLKQFALGKKNLLLIAIGFLVVVLGFILMTGKPSLDTAYNPDIFSFRRIILGPGIALGGFLFVIMGILYKKKEQA